MQPIEFSQQTTTIAKNQPQYRPLPAHICRDQEGTTTFCWKLTWRERFKLLLTGRLWHQVLSFHAPLQPQRLSTEKPQLISANGMTRDQIPSRPTQ